MFVCQTVGWKRHEARNMARVLRQVIRRKNQPDVLIVSHVVSVISL